MSTLSANPSRTPAPKPRAPDTRFDLLRRAFLRRFLDNELLSFGADAGPQTLIWLVALVMAPGVLKPLSWLAKYAALSHLPAEVLRAVRWEDGLWLLQWSMASTGLLTALVWDALLLDRRDVLVLSPLPVSWRTVCAAKIVALVTAWAGFAVALNLPPSFVFAAVASPHGIWSFPLSLLAQLGCALAASATVFASLIAFQAVLLNTVSASAFRRLTMLVQATALFGVVTLVLLRPLVPPNAWLQAIRDGSTLRLFPPLWFLALGETWRGSAPDGFLPLARDAYLALGGSVLAGAVAFLAGFGRHVRRTVESPEVQAAGATGYLARAARRVAHVVVRHPVERATFDFVVRSIARSPRHRLLIGAAAGIGVALMLPSLLSLAHVLDAGARAAASSAPSVTLLCAPLALTLLLLVAVRVGFRLPTDVGAAWVIRVTERADARAYVAGTRKAMVAIGVLPPILLLLPSYASLWGVTIAAAHALFCVLLSLLLIELLLVRFRSVPFTFGFLGIVDPRPGRWPLYPLIFGFYVFGIASIEALLLARPFRFVLGCAVMVLALAAARWARRRFGREVGLVFDIEPETTVTLNLATMPRADARAGARS